MIASPELREWPDAALVVGESAVRFSLHYQGDLPACTQTKTRVGDKERLRQHFHQQLLQLWQSEPLLSEQLDKHQAPRYALRMTGKQIQPDVKLDAMHTMVWVGDIPGLLFVPLVTRRNGLGCRLDIKFMRPGKRGDLVTGGDLDNRIKTLFDGLRMPHDKSEVVDSEAWKGKPQQLFYCLLEDDSLITDINVRTEPLLTRMSQSQPEVRLDIGVTIHVVAPSEQNRDYAE